MVAPRRKAVVFGFIILGALVAIWAIKLSNWKTLTVDGKYSIQYPANWNYWLSPDKEDLALSDYREKPPSFQDQSSEKENAKITIHEIAKEPGVAELVVNNVVLGHTEADYKIQELTIGLFPAREIEFLTPDYFKGDKHIIVETDKSVFWLRSVTFSDKIGGSWKTIWVKLVYYSFLMDRIVKTIRFF